MRGGRALLSLWIALASGGVVGCSNNGSPTSPTTTSTSNELFTGTLTPLGSTFFSFTVTAAGDTAITLASTTTARVGPAAPFTLTLGLGVPSGFGCAVSNSVDTSAGLTAQLKSTGAAPGIYCVSLSDSSGIPADILFVVRIVHT